MTSKLIKSDKMSSELTTVLTYPQRVAELKKQYDNALEKMLQVIYTQTGEPFVMRDPDNVMQIPVSTLAKVDAVQADVIKSACMAYLAESDVIKAELRTMDGKIENVLA